MRGHLIHISQPTVVGTAPHRQWSKPKSALQQHYPWYPSPYMVLKKQLLFSCSGGSDRQYLSKVRFRIWTKILPKQQGNESIMWETQIGFTENISLHPSIPKRSSLFPIWPVSYLREKKISILSISQHLPLRGLRGDRFHSTSPS